MILYGKTYLVAYYLNQISAQPAILNANNVLVGTNNVVAGTKNFLIGSNNAVTGSGNYIFSNNFNSSNVAATSSGSNSNLVLDEWLIQLLKLYQIPIAPNTVISRWM
jgi:hypothetical protein